MSEWIEAKVLAHLEGIQHPHDHWEVFIWRSYARQYEPTPIDPQSRWDRLEGFAETFGKAKDFAESYQSKGWKVRVVHVHLDPPE